MCCTSARGWLGRIRHRAQQQQPATRLLEDLRFANMCGLCRGAAWCLLRVALHVARWVPPVACQIRCDDASACGVAPRRAAHATASKRAARATLHRAECGKRFSQRVGTGSLHHGARAQAGRVTIHGTVANQQHGCAHSEQCKQPTSSVATHTNHNVQRATRVAHCTTRNAQCAPTLCGCRACS